MEESTKKKLLESRAWIREELERCTEFWLKNGMDPVNGGVYTCLDREWTPSTAVCIPALTARGKFSPRTRACGCRDAAAGSFPGCAIFTA